MKLISVEKIQKYTQTPDIGTDIDDIVAPILFVQFVLGHQVLDPNWSLRKNALKVLCSIFLLYYVIVGTIEVMQETDSIHIFSEAIVTLIVIFDFQIQIFAFAYNRATFREVYITAKTSLYNLIKETSPERGPYVLELIRKMVKMLFLVVLVPCSNYLIMALWFYTNGTRVTLSKSTSILMPMTSPTFEIGLILHLIFLFMVAFGIIVIDMWFVFLAYSFCEASDCAVKILKVERYQDEEDVSYSNRLNGSLKKFYAVHITLMQYLNMVSVMYKWPLLGPMFVMLANTCLFMLVWTEEQNWQLAIVAMTASVEMFAYNTLGEKIKSKAEDMKLAILNFDWISMRLKDRKNYYIITSYMTKDFGIHTAVGIDLSLLTMSSIYKGSYQAFAVLNTLND